MIYPKFPQRYLAAIVFCFILTLSALGAIFLIYLFNVGCSPLVMSAIPGVGGGSSGVSMKSAVGQQQQEKRNMLLQQQIGDEATFAGGSQLRYLPHSDADHVDGIVDDGGGGGGGGAESHLRRQQEPEIQDFPASSSSHHEVALVRDHKGTAQQFAVKLQLKKSKAKTQPQLDDVEEQEQEQDPGHGSSNSSPEDDVNLEFKSYKKSFLDDDSANEDISISVTSGELSPQQQQQQHQQLQPPKRPRGGDGDGGDGGGGSTENFDTIYIDDFERPSVPPVEPLIRRLAPAAPAQLAEEFANTEISDINYFDEIIGDNEVAGIGGGGGGGGGSLDDSSRRKASDALAAYSTAATSLFGPSSSAQQLLLLSSPSSAFSMVNVEGQAAPSGSLVGDGGVSTRRQPKRKHRKMHKQHRPLMQHAGRLGSEADAKRQVLQARQHLMHVLQLKRAEHAADNLDTLYDSSNSLDNDDDDDGGDDDDDDDGDDLLIAGSGSGDGDGDGDGDFVTITVTSKRTINNNNNNRKKNKLFKFATHAANDNDDEGGEDDSESDANAPRDVGVDVVGGGSGRSQQQQQPFADVDVDVDAETADFIKRISFKMLHTMGAAHRPRSKKLHSKALRSRQQQSRPFKLRQPLVGAESADNWNWKPISNNINNNNNNNNSNNNNTSIDNIYNLSNEIVSNLSAPQLYQDEQFVLAAAAAPTSTNTKTNINANIPAATAPTTVATAGAAKEMMLMMAPSSSLLATAIALHENAKGAANHVWPTQAAAAKKAAGGGKYSKLSGVTALQKQKQQQQQQRVVAINVASADMPTIGASSAAWLETRTRRIIGNVKKSEERSRQLLLCEEAGGGELCRMLFKGNLNE